MYSYQLQFIIAMIAKISDVEQFVRPNFTFTIELSDSDDYTRDLKEASNRLIQAGLNFKIKNNKLTIYNN